MDKIRLLNFCSNYLVGLTQAMTEQAEEIAKEPRVEQFVVSSENEQEKGLFDRFYKCGVRIDIIEGLDEHVNFKQLAAKIAMLIDNYDITHVNVHCNWQLALLAYVKTFKKTRKPFKLIYTIHGYRHNHPLKAVAAIGAIGAGLLLFSDRVISMSSYVSKRFWFLGYKTDLVFYMMNKPEYKKRVNQIDTTSLQMVFPAQFRHGKRQGILIKAVRKYIDRTGDTTIVLHLPGDGPTLPGMKELAAELNVSDNVKFYGKIPLSDVLEIYEKSNIALCSSNVETYGRCIAEPFMLGRCVITQKTGVAADIIRDRENGFFFTSPESLADILCMLHENPQLIKSVTDQSFKDREIFFPRNVMKSYIAALENA